ncbi:MAG: hypothetical protein HQL66_14800 [Magnetococcales bacterium]|nr:hypothetical protein [Magnetococcales bacterium]
MTATRDRKHVASSTIEKLEDRIAPAIIGGGVGSTLLDALADHGADTLGDALGTAFATDGGHDLPPPPPSAEGFAIAGDDFVPPPPPPGRQRPRHRLFITRRIGLRLAPAG